ncbi:hypothetical protein RDWZM_008204 [Blomia tropicalis]|uniref:Uncharacterized protein n=1 Tax=Blomia tropicalis TaxID=40697 RepID=A0A9Q0M370_BLOTA|nr:hypothetical protein RDWZM_008204 [Blomia tropicalis]
MQHSSRPPVPRLHINPPDQINRPQWPPPPPQSASTPMNNQNRKFRPFSQYLTVSSGGTSTCTELEGDDLIDVDYLSEYSFDLSNDEDDEENDEDIQSEVYLRNLFYSIDQIIGDDSTTSNTSGTLIDLPTNIIAECHVWKKKFKDKRLNAIQYQRSSSSKLNTYQTNVASIDEEEEFPIMQRQESSNYRKIAPNNTDRPLPIHKRHSLAQLPAGSSRVVLPPIINGRRPQSIDLKNGYLFPYFNKTTYNSRVKVVELMKTNDETQYEKEQTMTTYRSKSFNETTLNGNDQVQSNLYVNRISGSSTSTINGRITMNDLFNQSSHLGPAWSRRSHSQFPPNHMLKLPAI